MESFYTSTTNVKKNRCSSSAASTAAGVIGVGAGLAAIGCLIWFVVDQVDKTKKCRKVPSGRNNVGNMNNGGQNGVRNPNAISNMGNGGQRQNINGSNGGCAGAAGNQINRMNPGDKKVRFSASSFSENDSEQDSRGENTKIGSSRSCGQGSSSFASDCVPNQTTGAPSYSSTISIPLREPVQSCQRAGPNAKPLESSPFLTEGDALNFVSSVSSSDISEMNMGTNPYLGQNSTQNVVRDEGLNPDMLFPMDWRQDSANCSAPVPAACARGSADNDDALWDKFAPNRRQTEEAIDAEFSQRLGINSRDPYDRIYGTKLILNELRGTLPEPVGVNTETDFLDSEYRLDWVYNKTGRWPKENCGN